MKREIRLCAAMLSDLRDSYIRDREEELFTKEQKAIKAAKVDRIKKQAQELHVKLYG